MDILKRVECAKGWTEAVVALTEKGESKDGGQTLGYGSRLGDFKNVVGYFLVKYFAHGVKMIPSRHQTASPHFKDV